MYTKYFLDIAGSFELTWQEFIVAIESGLFMFPINILIITIFRHIKPRILLNKVKAGTSKKTTPAAAVSMNTIVKVLADVILKHNNCFLQLYTLVNKKFILL